ncbi:MAG: phosphoribosylformylglycinamidine cyclo-ligase [Dehalococcoidia bacterium]|nr:phosphoribosylformylglycinamidine cyclo-ligase [Dehalococcoidia bacterium]
MPDPKPSSYETAGVSLDAMDGLKDRIKAFAAMTHGPEVLDGSGGFAGLFALSGYNDPVLVASADGVGTKLKIAAQLGHFEGVGQDLVTLNVNDILTKGARPLFFLDYVSFSALDEHRLEMLIRGITWGCRESGCALIGGETAQLPGVYSDTDFDLAGFVVGVAERSLLLGSGDIIPGDRLIGIPSSGVHTNGFSLVRKVFNLDDDPAALFRPWPGLTRNLGDELMVRHRAYHPLLTPYLTHVKALSHITGGGLPGKMPASLPDDATAEFRVGSWPVPPVFNAIQKAGDIDDTEMYRVFNMGLGMVAVCDDAGARAVLAGIPDAVEVGCIVEREGHSQTKLTAI